MLFYSTKKNMFYEWLNELIDITEESSIYTVNFLTQNIFEQIDENMAIEAIF